ncbi:unnamed protein product [Closterium sp. NIES-64]|nr:unnamed protein product [Closterium sp. NIES-64]
MDYADAEVCVDALFACTPIDPVPLDFPLDPFPPSAFLLDSTPSDASLFDSCSGAFPGDHHHQHHQFPSRDSLFAADLPIPHAVAAPLSPAAPCSPVRHPYPSQQLHPPPALTAASASSLPRSPASLVSAAALPQTFVCASSNGSGGAGGREQAREGGNGAEQFEQPPRGAAAPLHGGVVPPPATASANSDAHSNARAAAPRGNACRPADLTGRLAAVLKGLAEGARDGNKRAAELARSDAWGATGAKRDVDGRRGWCEARNGEGEGERRKRTCVGSTGREGEQNGGARVGGAAVVCAAQGGVAAAVAAGEAEAAGMAEQAAALAGAAAQEGAALLANAQAVAAEGRAAHRRGEGEPEQQTGRSTWELPETEQREGMRGERVLSQRSSAAAAEAVERETSALWFTPPLSRRLQVSWAGDGVAAGRMGGAQQEAEAVRVRNLVMALGEAHATQDTLRLRSFTRRLQQQASAQGSPAQRVAWLFLAALHARSQGCAAVTWLDPVVVDGQALAQAPPTYGPVEWALYSFVNVAAATELSLALSRAWGDADAHKGVGPVGAMGDWYTVGGEGGREESPLLNAGSSSSSSSSKRRVHIIVFGCPDVSQWVSLLHRIAMEHSPPTTTAPHSSPSAPAPSAPSTPHVHVHVTCIDLEVVRMAGMTTGAEQLQMVGQVLAGIADMVGLGLSFHALHVHAHEFSPHMVHAGRRRRRPSGAVGTGGVVEDGCGSREGACGEGSTGERSEEGEEEVLVCCCWSMMAFPDATVLRSNPRDAIIKWMHSLRPRLIILSELDARLNTPFFLARFHEALRFFPAFLDALYHTVPPASPLRALLQGMLLRKLVNCVGCEGAQRVVRPESMEQWQERMERLGFERVALSEETVGNMRALTECKDGRFGIQDAQGAARLTWKGSPIMAVGAWRAV